MSKLLVKPPTTIAIIALFILVLVMFFVFITDKKSDALIKTPPTFTSETMICNSAPINLRFSCYRSAIEKYYKGNIPAFAAKLKNDKDLSFEESFENGGKISYAIFGTNCHTFYHAAGDFIATYSNDDLPTMLSLGPTSCRNGYTMGLYKRVALKTHYPDDMYQQFLTDCKKGAEDQCAHEIGHLLQDKYSGIAVLKIIDGVSGSQYHLSYPEKYDYIISQNETGQPDLNKPYEICGELFQNKSQLDQCDTGVAHNLFLYSEFANDGHKAMFGECANVSNDIKNSCYYSIIFISGLNEASTKFLSRDFAGGNKICDDLVTLSGRPDLESNCYRGLGSGIGLYVESTPPDPAETDQNKRTDTKNELLDYLKLCEKSNPGFVNSCYNGLMGTEFGKYYNQFQLHYDPFEKLKPPPA